MGKKKKCLTGFIPIEVSHKGELHSLSKLVQGTQQDTEFKISYGVFV